MWLSVVGSPTGRPARLVCPAQPAAPPLGPQLGMYICKRPRLGVKRAQGVVVRGCLLGSHLGGDQVGGLLDGGDLLSAWGEDSSRGGQGRKGRCQFRFQAIAASRGVDPVVQGKGGQGQVGCVSVSLAAGYCVLLLLLW